MVDKTIMLVCNAGMSTSMLVNKMNQVVEKENKSYTIITTSIYLSVLKQLNIKQLYPTSTSIFNQTTSKVN